MNSGSLNLIANCSLFIGLLACAGCSSENSPPVDAPPVMAAQDETKEPDTDKSSDQPAGRQAFDGMSFSVPSGWEAQPLSQMQQGIISARFGIPDVDPDLTVTLSVSGGSKEDNIARWEGQFAGGSAPQRETIRTEGGDAEIVRLSGQFSPGFGRPGQNGWTMLGLIIPLGPQHYFVKLTGPAAAVDRVETEFRDFCKSARPE